MTNKVPSHSLDLRKANIEKLKELFPELVTDGGRIDPDMFADIFAGGGS